MLRRVSGRMTWFANHAGEYQFAANDTPYGPGAFRLLQCKRIPTRRLDQTSPHKRSTTLFYNRELKVH